MFMDMIHRVKEDTLEKLCIVRIQREEEIDEMQERASREYVLSRGEEMAQSSTVKKDAKKVGRNDPCPCGSGKKYKKCCG